MRAVRVLAKAALAVGFVVGIVAGEPNDLAVTLECQDVGRDPVEEALDATIDARERIERSRKVAPIDPGRSWL